jgi:hypothetical protein
LHGIAPAFLDVPGNASPLLIVCKVEYWFIVFHV